MRPIYRVRRDLLLTALARYLPELRPVGASAGLHVLTWLTPDLEEAPIIEAAARAGIRVQGVGVRPAAPNAVGGLTFGYGALAEASIEPGIRRLAGVLADLRAAAASSD